MRFFPSYPYLDWFWKARPTRSMVPIARWIGEHYFALKGGGYGCLFRVRGVDPECLSGREMRDVLRKIEAANRRLPENGRLTEIARKLEGVTLPREAHYESPAVEKQQAARHQFLNETARFRRLDAHQIITVQPPKMRRKLKPTEARRQSEELLFALERAAEERAHQLRSVVGLDLCGQQEMFSFFSYLFGLEEWSWDRRYDEQSSRSLDDQIASMPVHWNTPYLEHGKRQVQVWSAYDYRGVSRANIYQSLLTQIPGDVLISASWQPDQQSLVRKLAEETEKHIGMTANSLSSVAAAKKETLEKTAGARAAHKKVDRVSGVLSDLDENHAYGTYQLRIAAHSREEAVLRRSVNLVNRILVDAETDAVEETDGNLAAYYALCPGNEGFSIGTPKLRADYQADRSFVFFPDAGFPVVEELDREYLNIYQTRTETAYFDDLFVNGVGIRLVLGPTGTGKSMTGNFIVAGMQKYQALSTIYDLGGSYDWHIRHHGGSVAEVGANGPAVALFANDPQDEKFEDDLLFRFGFIRVLLERSGATIGPKEEEVIESAVRNIYLYDPSIRSLGNLALTPDLRRCLRKWMKGGIYGRIFDNTVTEIPQTRVRGYDFSGVTKQMEDMLEPLLLWLMYEDGLRLRDRNTLGTPKLILIEELFTILRNPGMLQMVLDRIKGIRKQLGTMVLIGQSLLDLGANMDLILNSCSSFLLLPDSTFNRELYAEKLNLNSAEVKLFEGLNGEDHEAFLKRKGEYGKVVRLHLDPEMHFLFTTKPKEKAARAKAIQEHGFEGALALQTAGPKE